MLLFYYKESYIGMNANTCGFDMVRELRVCVLAFDVRSSKLEPSKQENDSPVLALYYYSFNNHMQQLLVCEVHSHVDRVGLQWSIAETLSVVILHAVIVLSDHICSCRTCIAPQQGLSIPGHTPQITSDVCVRAWRSVHQRARWVGEPLVSHVRGRTIKKCILPGGQVLDVLHYDRVEKRIAQELSQILPDLTPLSICLQYMLSFLNLAQ